jgi:hypothetical protein
MPIPQLISISPNPIPSVPCWVLVCYNFDDGATSPVILEVSFGGIPDEFKTQVSKEEPCVRVYVPAGATSVQIVDTTMQSQDKAAQVLP